MNSPSGTLARFRTAEQLTAAARALEEGGWREWETFSPHPVVGTECRVRLGAIGCTTLISGIFGFAAAVAMQIIPTCVLYPISVGGKSAVSLPAFFPIVFESTILFAAVGAFAALLCTASLPRWYRPIFDVEEFRKVSRDAYFVAVYTGNSEEAARFLTALGGEHIAALPREDEEEKR